jgi:hypothetical protein
VELRLAVLVASWGRANAQEEIAKYFIRQCRIWSFNS